MAVVTGTAITVFTLRNLINELSFIGVKTVYSSTIKRSGTALRTIFALLTALPALPGLALAQDAGTLPAVTVEDDRIWPPAVETADPASASVLPSSDAGDFLRSIPGVDGGRMGGHGIEPVIRGQKQNQINIVNDGAYVFGGCPNRMDPSSSLVNIETVDSVKVLKGYESVQYGPGGTGGTVLFEKDIPRFQDGKYYLGQTGGGYETNGSVKDGYARAAVGNADAFIRAGGKWKDAGNYKDGNGDKVRSAFKQYGGELEAGLTSANGLFSFGYESDNVTDALFAGASMDSPYSYTDTFRLKLERENLDIGPVGAIRFNAYSSLVDHRMDNFSLRTSTGNKMLVNSDSNTYGGKIAADGVVFDVPVTFGLDLQVNNRDALRYMNASEAGLVSSSNLNSYLWPDMTISQLGAFGEGTVPLDDTRRAKIGLRYDRVTTDYGAADVSTPKMGGGTANTLYSNYYGVRGDANVENNIGGLLRFEQDFSTSATVYAGVSRSVRTADATERGIAAKAMGTNKAWVGNPDIAPEKHHQADIGLSFGKAAWDMNASVYADRVSDYILRDTARGQTGILKSDGATIYRNVEALLSGFDLSGGYAVASDLKLGADVAYTYGENLTDGAPLAQIPPLSGSLSMIYEPEGWSIGSRMRWASKQTRVDADTSTGSGLDVGKTSGYAVFDVFGSYNPIENVRLDAGVSNLFDKTYANHLNRSNSFDPAVVQVNEPGRSMYLRAKITF